MREEGIELLVFVLVLILHFIFVRFRVYEKILFFLASHLQVVDAFLNFLIVMLAELKSEEVKKVLREFGIQIYILVEQWARKNGKRGEEKFEKFLEIMKEIGVDVEKNMNEITKFVEIVNFVQNNESGEFFDKAKKVIDEVFKVPITTKILGKFVKIVLLVFGILK